MCQYHFQFGLDLAILIFICKRLAVALETCISMQVNVIFKVNIYQITYYEYNVLAKKKYKPSMDLKLTYMEPNIVPVRESHSALNTSKCREVATKTYTMKGKCIGQCFVFITYDIMQLGPLDEGIFQFSKARDTFMMVVNRLFSNWLLIH